jgi:hypothetical protein
MSGDNDIEHIKFKGETTRSGLFLADVFVANGDGQSARLNSVALGAAKRCREECIRWPGLSPWCGICKGADGQRSAFAR